MGISFLFTPTFSGTQLGSKKDLDVQCWSEWSVFQKCRRNYCLWIDVQSTAGLFLSNSFVPSYWHYLGSYSVHND